MNNLKYMYDVHTVVLSDMLTVSYVLM